MSLTLQSKRKLRDGNEIPLLGFGTYELDGQDAFNGVKWALQTGYRHIDSAAWYENEAECGRAILEFCAETGTPRAAIFFTTKLKSNDGHAATAAAIRRSVDASGLGYLDLYLMHSPLGGHAARRASWEAVLEAKAAGLIKSAGVSCFNVKHLQELEDAGLERPSINQIDLHPFMTRTAIVDYCNAQDIALEAWAPLVRGMRFKHSLIVALAKKHEKEPAQVLLRYSLQKGFIALPKSSSKARIESNTHLYDFELTPDEMKKLDSLDEYLVTDWDPTDCE